MKSLLNNLGRDFHRNGVCEPIIFFGVALIGDTHYGKIFEVAVVPNLISAMIIDLNPTRRFNLVGLFRTSDTTSYQCRDLDRVRDYQRRAFSVLLRIRYQIGNLLLHQGHAGI
jgi:hypothetical protein